MSLARLWPIAAAVAVAGCGSAAKHQAAPPNARPAAERALLPAQRVLIPAGSGNLAAMAPRAGLTLRDRPGGRVIAHLKATTIYGSPTVVWAAQRRGHWLGVVATTIGNDRIGWLDVARDRPRMWRSAYELVAHLSRRTLELRRGSRLIRTIRVTIGNAATPTPVGRFSVTDKLGSQAGGTYGCCILALNGHQPRLRAGWTGSTRIAIHGSPAQLVGTAASAGCLRATDRELRALMKILPLGTPVTIRP
jgi:hypothetical protein